jgi:hypothetical protein
VLEETEKWIEEIEGTIVSTNPYFGQSGAYFPRLFMTPHAPGIKKIDAKIIGQGHKAIMRYELNMLPILEKRNIEHFGTYNLSVQALIPDGS